MVGRGRLKSEEVMAEQGKLSDRVALVTDSDRNIGRATIVELA